ncbi:hypothetical protein [Streptomyces sp. NL15-2K]|uniref:hypothetical protein n=1 Tax=Streptomyces sp. NL15-2K TaxID=376149 RepID=UPI0026965239|nr:MULTISPECIES: hypothetical protein [Actinomycetes]WKX15867.1 hypothetical protein Q4V64_53625 [Kutzneria buriramensis]
MLVLPVLALAIPQIGWNTRTVRAALADEAKAPHIETAVLDGLPRHPNPDLCLAQDCGHCHEWGTVVTPDGHHELCPACQSRAGGDFAPHVCDETVGRAAAHP